MITQDVFPATVVVAGSDLDVTAEELRSYPPTPGAAAITIARVVVTADRIIIARDAGTGPQIVFSEGIDPTLHYKSPSPRTSDSYVVTLTGKKVAYRKDSSCGCGSRLKSWRPFNNMSSVKDPTE